MEPLVLSDASRTLAGILLVAFVTIETGGAYLLKLSSGHAEITEFQRGFARAGHAHAGVLVLLALVCQLYVDVADRSGLVGWHRLTRILTRRDGSADGAPLGRGVQG